ncbi:MAG: hypothetical protein FWD43_01520 [Coriobacteriia bacterium]|nr:hypothetical protein [Coriobacteriia bacterium]
MAAPSRSRAFFLEFVLDLVVFALCAIISMQVFFEARMTSNQSSALSHMAIEAQIIAETFKAKDGNAEAIVSAVRSMNTSSASGSVMVIEEGKLITIYYDRDFKLTTKDDASYRIECRIDSSGAVKIAHIAVYDRTKEIFSLEARDYVPSSSVRGGGA